MISKEPCFHRVGFCTQIIFLGSRGEKMACRKQVFLRPRFSLFYGEERYFFPSRGQKAQSACVAVTRTISSAPWAEKLSASFLVATRFISALGSVLQRGTKMVGFSGSRGCALRAPLRPSSQKTSPFLYLAGERTLTDWWNALPPEKKHLIFLPSGRKKSLVSATQAEYTILTLNNFLHWVRIISYNEQ